MSVHLKTNGPAIKVILNELDESDPYSSRYNQFAYQFKNKFAVTLHAKKFEYIWKTNEIESYVISNEYDDTDICKKKKLNYSEKNLILNLI